MKIILFIMLLLTLAWPVAAAVKITPVRLFLSDTFKVDAVTITNETNAPLVMSIKAFAWGQGQDGADIRTPTDDLFFLPRILRLEPGEQKNVRVGYNGKAEVVEKSFRLLFKEEIQAERQVTFGALLLVDFNIPVFFAPRMASEATVEAAGVAVTRNKLSFTVRNKGNVHVMPKVVRAVLKDKKGNALHSGETSGWYVLPGSSRKYSFDIPAQACESAATLLIRLELDEGSVIERELPVNTVSCAG